MDDSHPMLNFFGNPDDMTIPTSPNPDEDSLLYFFSSPTTQAEDSSLPRSFASSAVQPQPQFLSSSHTPEDLAQLASFITPNATSQPQQVPSFAPNTNQHMHGVDTPHAPREQHPSVTMKAEPSPAPVTSTSSDSNSARENRDETTRKGFSRLGGKKRSLKAMQAVAKRNAPKVTLSDEELVEISEMHESEASLAESKELFLGIVAFKRCLARHGYQLKSLYVDSIPQDESVDSDETPFSFVLNKNPKPPPGTEKSDQSDAPEPQPQETTSNRGSVTLTTTSEVTAQPDKEAALPTATPVERPRKRARISERADSSNCDQMRLICTVCVKKMSDFQSLVRHFRHAHQEMKPFMCPKCKGFYSSEGTLWHHLNNVHSESRRIHKCEYCDASYDSSGAKTRHVHGTHHKQRPLYECTFPDCNRTFIFPAHLENHANVEHKGFRPFQCDECSKTFSSANGLVRHCREVHRKEKAYTCPVCQTGLTKRCHLKRHLLNVHHLPIEIVDVEMKRHPNPGDIPALKTAANTGKDE